MAVLNAEANIHDRLGRPCSTSEDVRADDVRTDEVRARLLEELLLPVPLSVAAALAGIPLPRLLDWMRDDRELARDVAAAQARCQKGLVVELTRLARGLPPPPATRGEQARRAPNMAAILFLLERRFSEDWKQRAELTVKVEEDDPLAELEQKWGGAVVDGEATVLPALALPAGAPAAEV